MPNLTSGNKKTIQFSTESLLRVRCALVRDMAQLKTHLEHCGPDSLRFWQEELFATSQALTELDRAEG